MTDPELILRERKSERRNAAKELGAAIAHEIKNPLSPIRGYAQLLLKKLDAVDESERPLFEKALLVIERETRHLDDQLRRLLTLARDPEDDEPKPTDLEATLREAIALVEGSSGGLTITLEGKASRRVLARSDDLRSAFVNLLENSLESTREASGSSVLVRISGDAPLRVEILDEGTGILHPEKLFELFASTKASGTGLGLRIARAAIERSGGTLGLEDRADRRGAIAIIEIPKERLSDEPGATP
ncbi:MAG: HAMP domain-containing histidine kinase [Deltaproteobacteria bacterium]|nr:HAMP domain-containing histidine kinase [Deltaproteobacteria bacterium]